jgi:pyridoxal phosphate enzyme (YggS family)
MAVEINLDPLLRKISESVKRSGRNENSVHLVAVTKTVDPDRIIESLNKGIQILGENRVQEALSKMEIIRSKGFSPEWHFIGKLQRNKAKLVVGRFSLIHSVDTMMLAEEISRHAEKRGMIQEVLLEINLSGESTKEGFSVQEALACLDRLTGLRYVKIKGLMTIPPPCSTPEDSRPYFRNLKELGGEIASRLGNNDLLYSMGMSDDFQVAIEEGATHIRVGRAIFGERSH